MDFKNITIWTFVGAVSWEIFKQLLTLVFKRPQDSRDAQIKLLRQDVEEIISLALEIHENIMEYYSLNYDSDEAKTLSKQIKAKMKTTGMKLSSVNFQFLKNDKYLIDIKTWTDFKLTATENLDVKRVGVWNEGDARITNIYIKTHRLQFGLNKARYGVA